MTNPLIVIQITYIGGRSVYPATVNERGHITVRYTLGTGVIAALLVFGLSLSAVTQADAAPTRRYLGKWRVSLDSEIKSSAQRDRENLTMIQLQQTISQRQTAVQLTTGVLEKTRPSKQFINNIR